MKVIVLCAVLLLIFPQGGGAEESCDLARTVAGKGAAAFANDKAAGTKLFIKARELCRTDPAHAYNLGLAYCLQGKFVQALPLLEEAVDRQGDRPVWRNNLAVTLLELKKDYPEALRHAETAARTNAGSPATEETLAQARMAGGKRLEALAGLHEALVKKPKDTVLKSAYSRVLEDYLALCLQKIKDGDEDEGLAGLMKAQFEPKAQRAQALALTRLGRGEEGLAVAHSARQRFPDNNELAKTAGEVADVVARGLYRDFKSGKGAVTVQRAKQLAAAYPLQPLKEAYDKLLEALLNDTSTVHVASPESSSVGEETAEAGTVASEAAGSVNVQQAADPAAPLPPKLEVASVEITSADGEQVVKKGVRSTIMLTLKNSGGDEARGVGVLVESGDKNVVVTDVKKWWKLWGSGPVVTDPEKSTSLKVPKGKSEKITFNLDVADDFQGENELPITITTVTKEPETVSRSTVKLAFKANELQPKLEIAAVEIDSTDGGRVVRKGARSRVVLTIKNAGEGVARGVGALLESADPHVTISDARKWWMLWSHDNRAIMTDDNTVTSVTLPPGQSEKIAFVVDVAEGFTGNLEVPLTVKLVTTSPKTSEESPLKLAYEPLPPNSVVAGKGAESDQSFFGRIFSAILPGTKEQSEALPLKVTVPDDFRTFTDKDHAVIIGIERYRGNLPPSEFSKNDARSVKNYLLAMGFEERNIDTLTDDRATLADIRAVIERKLKNRSKKQSRVFFYFSGHGAPDPSNGDAYIVPYDGDPNYIADTGYSLSQLYANLGKLQVSEVTVVLDSCFSGSGGRSVVAKGMRPLVVKSKSIPIPSNVAVLTSTNGGQISTTYQQARHGLFTWYFLKAISDGRKNLAEIYEYLRPQVEDEAKRQNVEQTPVLNVASKGKTRMFVLQK